MFNDSSRRVDLSGRRSSGSLPLHSNRSALLEQSRKERQQRLQQKEQQVAVVRLQAFIRSRQAVSRLRQQQRAAFDLDIQRTLARYRQLTSAVALPVSSSSSSSSSSPSPLADLLLCIRRFLFFHSRRCASDGQRWQLLVQTLTLSLRSPQPQPLPARPSLSSSAHYGVLPLLPGSEWRHVWIHQVRRLTALLLSDIAAESGDGSSGGNSSSSSAISSASGSSVTAAAFLLFQLFAASQWSVSQGSKSAVSAIAGCQLAALQSVVFVVAPAASPRLVLTASWHAALRSRILRMADLSAAAVSTADRNTLGLMSLLTVTPLQLAAASSSASLSLPFAASFVCHILSIPLLSARLTAAGLTAVLASVTEPGTVMAALQLMASENRAATAQSPLSAALSSLPAVPSFSPWDAQQSAAASAASTGGRQLALESEDEDDGSEAGRGRSGDSDVEMEAPISGSASSSPRPQSLWLLGNLLDWQSQLLTDGAGGEADSRRQQRSRAAALLAVMQELLLLTPSRDFPSLAAAAPPLLWSQLSVAWSRSFLDSLIARLRSAAAEGDAEAASRVCGLLESLLSRLTSSGQELLNALAFSTDIVRWLWELLRHSGAVRAVTEQQPATAAAAAGGGGGGVLDADAAPLLSTALPLLCSCYAHLLPVLTDAEFWGDDDSGQQDGGASAASQLQLNPQAGSPIPILQQRELVAFLVALAYRLYWLEEAQHALLSSSPPQRSARRRLRSRLSSVLRLLRERQSRRSFAGESEWIMKRLPFAVVENELRTAGSASSRASRLFSALPFVFPFHDRLRFFYERLEQDKAALAVSSSVSFDAGRGVKATIRRSHLLEDGFTALHELGERLKGRVSIEFVDRSGLREPGLDGGGLFREFVSELIKLAFDPAWGLFCCNEEQDAYPNPDALLLLPEQDDPAAAAEHRHRLLSYYFFIGQMIGKLLYERLQAETRFASFFLRSLLGLVNTLDDLPSLDRQLYRSLVQLRKFTPQQIAELQLTFSVDRPTALGSAEMEAVPLMPGGLTEPLTAANVSRYLHLMADYKLSRSLRPQSLAFQRGLQSVVPQQWLTVFTAEELRLLISGEDRVDLSDLQQHTAYASGYSATHEVIVWFWQTVQSMSDQERSQLLRFVTSIPRQPLQGFAALNPRFCIQRVDYSNNLALPTSSTCVHLLRLPRYSSRAELRDRLLYAINNGIGFGLT